ncbi:MULTISPECIES: AMP-binding protein, partial [Burkholderia]|uniref:AMP-binding protein n=1 Tax=Burkholderia TaxID=32008 RepID=UPI00064EF09A
GSTGKPKGAMNEHCAVVNRLLWMQQQYQLQPDERVLQKTPFSFDVSVWEFFWPLLTGAGLVVARPQGHQDPLYIAELLRDANVTTLHFVPSMLQVFLDQTSHFELPALQRVICSGEALPYVLQQRFMQRFPHVELHNLYGPTEAAIDVTFWQCRSDGPLGKVPIGRPIANTRLYILDAHQ